MGCLEERGQWLENVDQTHKVKASGKLVLQKKVKRAIVCQVVWPSYLDFLVLQSPQHGHVPLPDGRSAGGGDRRYLGSDHLLLLRQALRRSLPG